MVQSRDGVAGVLGLGEDGAAELAKQLWLRQWRNKRFKHLNLNRAVHSTAQVKCECCGFDFLTSRLHSTPDKLRLVSVAFAPYPDALARAEEGAKVGQHYYLCPDPNCGTLMWSHIWEPSLKPLMRHLGDDIEFIGVSACAA